MRRSIAGHGTRNSRWWAMAGTLRIRGIWHRSYESTRAALAEVGLGL